MTWWKIGLIGTVLWLIGVVVVGGAVVISITNSRPRDPQNAKLRSQKAGQAVGAVSAPLLMGIWFCAWRRRPTSEPIEIADRSARRFD